MRHPNLTHLRYAPVLLGFVLCLVSTFARAQAPFTWTRHLASNLKNSAVAADYDGNVYSLAAFTGTVTVGNRIFKSQGGTDLLLVK